LAIKHSEILASLEEAQNVEHDNREMAREAVYFIGTRSGQWQPDVAKLFDEQPRYTIDLTSGIVNDAHGEISGADFAIKVRPAGGPATSEIAEHYEGIIRTIENNSSPSARYIYRDAAKQMLVSGIAGWGVKHGFRDSQSFDQDIMIYPISNFVDSVWFDPDSELRDASDAEFGFKLSSLSMSKYLRMFPKGSRSSVGRDMVGNVYSHKKSDAVVVGEYFYKKYYPSELVLMSNGSVFTADEKFSTVQDELQQNGVTEISRRKISAVKVMHYAFDGSDFLTGAEETAFSYIPLIPLYGNFFVVEDKVLYWGIVEKHMDPQRILNYAESRRVGEGALAPRAKKWMTAQQAKGYERQLRTMNTNADPIQFYNFISDQPQPFETGGAQINPGLTELSTAMARYMQSISGRVDPSGDPTLGLQSGVALTALQNKGDVGNVSYLTALEVAISHTCRVIGGAIPRIYDTRREIQLSQQDGTSKPITINQQIVDEDTGNVVTLNDLAKGTYSFICSAGAAFHNRQQETTAAIQNVAALDPTILQTGADIYLANIPAPGMDRLAKRKRAQMVMQGLIPDFELSEEEAKQVQAQQQNQGPSAAEQALLATAEAERMKAEANVADLQSKAREREDKDILNFELLKLKTQELKVKQENLESKTRLERDTLENELILRAKEAEVEAIKTGAETLSVLRDAMGLEAIINGKTTASYEAQSENLLQKIRKA
jgi:hypothetical protein